MLYLYIFLQYHTNDSYCGVPLFPSQVKEALQKNFSSLQRPTLDLLAQVYSAERLHVSLKNLSVPQFAAGWSEDDDWSPIWPTTGWIPGESHSRFGFLPVTLTQLYNSTHRFARMILLKNI